jgi:hypothetical protein
LILINKCGSAIVHTLRSAWAARRRTSPCLVYLTRLGQLQPRRRLPDYELELASSSGNRAWPTGASGSTPFDCRFDLAAIAAIERAQLQRV